MINSIEKVLVIGATGVVGRALLFELNALEACKKITIVVRQLCQEWQNMKKIEQIVLTDFLLLNTTHICGYDQVFSCLGTTRKKAGSRAAFYAIDYKINLHVAQLLHDSQQKTHFLIVSSIGANPKSSIFYSRVKGQIERDLRQLNLFKLSIFRPSLLLAKRPEARGLEDVAQQLYAQFARLITGAFSYKPVYPQQVVHTMVEAARNQTEKCEIYANLQIQKH